MSTGYAAPVGGPQPGEIYPSGDIRQITNLKVELYQEYFFFLDTTANAFYCIVEEITGSYRHFGFGEYNTIGQTAGGGQFCWGTYLSSLLSLK